ncbi:MAG: Asp-tRNA(Asn)/Glu-tRNA(Gln) amidotransferase subunit GatB [Clostridia bacterium]
MSREDYEVVIGLEVHAELSTKTKIFCGCSTEFGAQPNAHTCPICMAMPGTLPVLNEKVVEYAVKAGLATHCSISKDSKNDRKNYFYPDLPKSYQISQFDKPLCNNGYIEIEDEEGNKKQVRILRIHIEEDSGKLNHNEFGGGSLIDLNRAGVPLIEIVSEPDIRSAKEADQYLRKLKSTLEYIEVSDCKMQEGSFRADVNVSVHKPGTPLGTRTEMKNMNSFKSISRGIEYEIQRQIEVLENGGIVEQETLRWDDVSGRTFSMRDKEDAQDYRYFPEPDLVAIKLSDEYIENIRKTLPELPESRKERYMSEYKLSEKDARLLTASKYLSNLFEDAEKICKNAKAVANWLLSDVSRILNEEELEPENIPFTGKELAKLVSLIDNKTISSAIGKKVLEELFTYEKENVKDPEEIIKEKGWIQISDEGAIKEVVMQILEANPQSIADYKAGKDRALGFLVGQAMKATKGKANPQMLNQMFIEELKK